MQAVSIGEELEFELRAQIPVAQLRNFEVRDELPAGLSCAHAPMVDLDAPPYDAAGFVPGGQFTPTCTPTEVVWSFGDQTLTMTPGGSSRFDFPVHFIARVDNVLTNQDAAVLRNGGTSTITTVSYIDENMNSVVLSIDEAAVLVSEPELDLTKAFSVADVDAGDLPRVIVTLTNDGTAPAYNPRILEDLSAVKLSYAGDVQGAAPPSADLVSFGADRPLFTWAPGSSIAPGETLTFSFAVSVDLDAEPLELLANTIQADWTSLPGTTTALNPSGSIGPDGSATGMRIGALPNVGDPLNDYEDEASESVPVRSVLLTKTDLDLALLPEIGVHKPFEVEIALPEGTIRDVVLSDDLASGAVSYVLADTAAFDITYEFIGIATIAGAAPSEAAFTAVPADGDSGVVTWSIGTVVTLSEDDLVASAISPTIRIRYFARVNNDLVTDSGDTLQNGAQVTYPHGETGLPEIVTDDTAAIVAIEPDLTATKALSNVTAGKAVGDPPEFGDTLQYVVTIPNVGNSIAYDVNIVDTLPPELTFSSAFTPTATIDAVPVVGFVAAPTGAPAGPLLWGRGNSDGSLDLPAGSSLALTYQVEVTLAVPGGGMVDNEIFVDWTSLEAASPFERTGNGCPTITPPDDYCYGPAIASGTLPPIAPPDPLLKENTQATAAIGEAFVYRLTIPSSPYAFPQYDVRITDDLVGSAADLQLLSVARISGSGAWTPTNTGTPTAPVIEDTTLGIDIPAGEQIVLELTVVLEDTPTNTSGLPFTNTANFVYNWIDGDPASQRPGQAGTSPPMTIVGPDIVNVTKTGPAGMTLGVPGSFTLDLHNAGTGPAWNLRLVDQLPDEPTGGTCDSAPTVLSARIFESDGTPVSGVLVAGADYAITIRPAPDCELELAMLSATAAIGADQRLIVQYETTLDFDTQDGVSLTNVAGATEWFSADATNPGGALRRTFSRVLTNGTVLTLDHEDAHTVDTALPQLRFEKTVSNLTTGESPATSATPGDTLHYRLYVENLAAVAVSDFGIRDELDRLNAPPLFAAGSLANLIAPALADTSGTSATGGTSGTGLLDVAGLSLANLGDSLVVEFDITLTGVIANGSVVTNQSQLIVDGTPILDSDDPGVNGQAAPLVAGDEDPTTVPIVSAPAFRVQKSSTDLTGDPLILLAGETLRYTITLENIGTDHATDTILRDAIPVNTSYVAGSTTLNGSAVPDGAGGIAPLSTGIPIQAQGDPTPGSMRADGTLGNDVAMLTFDVVIDPGVVDGTVISNQAFVSAPLGGVVDQPSDDPDTPLPDDPTLDVVGNAPLLFAPKSVVIGVDNNANGVVDPLDILHYTITVYNNGAVPATLATLARHAGGCRSRQYDVGDGFTAIERPARGRARRRRLAARSGHRDCVLRPHASPAGRGRRHADPGPERRDRVRSPGRRRNPDRHSHLEPGHAGHRRAAEPVDRRRRQPGHRPRAHGRGGGCGPAALDHQAGDRGRRRRGPRRRTARVRGARDQRRDRRRPERRHQAQLRSGFGEPERPADRRRLRRLGADRRLLDDVRRAGARCVRGAALPGRHRARPADRHAHHQHGRRPLEHSAPERERERHDRCRRNARDWPTQRHGLARHRLRRHARRWRLRPPGLERRAAAQRRAGPDGTDRRRRPVDPGGRHTQRPERRSVRDPVQRAGGQQHQRGTRTRGLGLHERAAGDPRSHRDVRLEPAGPEPADRPQRRGLWGPRSRARHGCDRLVALRGYGHRAAQRVFRRSGPAGPGDAQ
jgi:uncharacterized repeat protein (TIGR01451 family)